MLTGALAHTEALTEGLDLETLLMLRRRFFTLVQQEVQRYGGTVQHFADDGFLAFFGTPVTHEDHAQRAVLAAYGIEIQMPAGVLQLAVAPGFFSDGLDGCDCSWVR